MSGRPVFVDTPLPSPITEFVGQIFSANLDAENHHASGSAVIVSPHLAFTARHVLDHRQRVSRIGPMDLVFGNRKGDPLRESKLLRNVLQPAAEAAGLGRVTWHQFRHIHSSLLNDLKVPVKIAQEQLGHASISTTLNIYTHVVDSSHRKAIEALERELFPTVPKSSDPDESVKPVSGCVALE